MNTATVDKAQIMYTTNQSTFPKISGSPIAYWVSEALGNAFVKGCEMTTYVDTFLGIITGDNDAFLRQWFEVEKYKVVFHGDNIDSIDLKRQYWIPYNKGGDFRRWYGIQEDIINWENGPNDKRRGKRDYSKYYLREYVAWSYTVSSSAKTIATRYYPNGFLWDVRGSGIFDKSHNLFYLTALISSKVGFSLLRVKTQALSCQVENIAEMPVIINEKFRSDIEQYVKENVTVSRIDYEAFETSWDFKKHPLV